MSEHRVLAVGDRLESSLCDVVITRLGSVGGDTWGWCRPCGASHCIDRAMYEQGRGPWRPVDSGEKEQDDG